jgi:hypothetical protein
VKRIKISEPVIQRLRLLPGDAVLCRAIVDPHKVPGVWRVTVFGCPPYDETIVYNIKAPTEDDAAACGIRWFVETQKQRREDRLRMH